MYCYTLNFQILMIEYISTKNYQVNKHFYNDYKRFVVIGFVLFWSENQEVSLQDIMNNSTALFLWGNSQLSDYSFKKVRDSFAMSHFSELLIFFYLLFTSFIWIHSNDKLMYIEKDLPRGIFKNIIN